MEQNLATHKTGDWWNGLTIPQILRKGPLEDDVYEPVDITGCVVTMQVREKATDAASLLDLRSDGDDPQITITEPNGPIVIAGRIISLEPKTYVYEVEILFPDSGPKTWLGGQWTITQDVVRRSYE